MDGSQSNLKKVLRTAIVGVKPADQVMLKGYLRVLLRLEADLEWVSASHSQVDLFMINHEFKFAASITKLLAEQQQKPVLYISRTDIDEGWLADDQLILPLKKLDNLNAWLMRSVEVLTKSAGTITSILQHHQVVAEPLVVEQIVVEQSPAPSQTVSLAPTAKHPVQAEHYHLPSVTRAPTPDYRLLISTIQQLQQRQSGRYQLVSSSKVKSANDHLQNDSLSVVAIIEPCSGRLWLTNKEDNAASILDLQWQLQPYQGNLPVASEACDLIQWLWQQGWRQASLLLPLVNDDVKYQLRYWIKPSLIVNHEPQASANLTKKERQDLISVMTALEFAPCDVNQLASLASISIKTTKKIVGSLLFAGCLQDSNYTQLSIGLKQSRRTMPENPAMTSANTQDMNEVTRRHEEQENVTASHTLSNPAVDHAAIQSNDEHHNRPLTSGQQEKRSFLSRFRQKLGL